jgi:protein involved in polysaccharide export with SLBB domain
MNKTKIAFYVGILTLLCCAFLSSVRIYAADDEERKEPLGPGDKINVRIPIEPALSGEYELDERGKFFLPILNEGGVDLGPFYVQGMTADEAEKLIEDRLGEYYADSKVTVELSSRGVRPGQSVSVFGVVEQPGTYRYFDGMRLLDLLIKCNRIGVEADLGRLALYRKDQPAQFIDARGVVDGTDMTGNVELLPGDYIIVPSQQTTMKMKIVVLGKVVTPGTVLIPEGSQILDLIGYVGGTTGRAAVARIYVIRAVDGKPIVVECDLKALLSRADLKQNIEIKNGDIVFVPETSRVDIKQIINDLVQLGLVKSVYNTVN